MIEARAKAGMKALYAWLQRCVGELRRGTFGKLLEMLVESVVMYGAEVWGCCRQLGEPCESSWELEGCTPKCRYWWKWRCYIRVGSKTEVCGILWYRVMKLGDERLVKHVAVEACKQREMKWMKDLRQSIREILCIT